MTGLPAPPEGWLLGVDVSQFQGVVDVPALQAAGASFLYARATDGEHSIDSRWAANAAACIAAGMPFGAYGVLEPYGFARATGQGQRFAEHVINSGACLPPALDFELAKGLSGLEALRSAVAWCQAVEDALLRQTIVYAGPAFIATLERFAGEAGEPVALELATRPLWVAHYTQSDARPPTVPKPWADWTIWQASGDRPRNGRLGSRNFATLPGHPSVDVDVDFYRGTVGELRALGCCSSSES